MRGYLASMGIQQSYMLDQEYYDGYFLLPTSFKDMFLWEASSLIFLWTKYYGQSRLVDLCDPLQLAQEGGRSFLGHDEEPSS